MKGDKVSINTVTKVYKFLDPGGEIAKLGRSGVAIEDLLERYRENLREVKIVRGNVFLLEGIEYIWKAVTGATGLTPFNEDNSHIGVGDGTDEEKASQTGLTGANKFYKKVDSGYPKVDGNKIIFRATFGPDEANFTWNEWTVANGPDDSAVNLNRKRENLGTKSAGATWVLTVELSIS